MGICVLPFVLLAAGAVAALMGKDAYHWLTREDGFAENMQVVFYSLSFVLSLVLAHRLRGTQTRWIAPLYLYLAAGFFFLVGEELSWGQRILGWSTPESLQAINKQRETNLHNIYGVGSTFKWIQLLVGAYGALLPVVVARWRALAPWRLPLSFLVPHFTLIPYFGCMFIWKLFRTLIETPRRFNFVVKEYNEVIELILSIGFFLFLIYQKRRLNGSLGPAPSGELQSAEKLDPV